MIATVAVLKDRIDEYNRIHTDNPVRGYKSMNKNELIRIMKKFKININVEDEPKSNKRRSKGSKKRSKSPKMSPYIPVPEDKELFERIVIIDPTDIIVTMAINGNVDGVIEQTTFYEVNDPNVLTDALIYIAEMYEKKWKELSK